MASGRAEPPATEPDEVQVRARALGDPTRFHLYRHLADAGGPCSVAELTEALGVHHNAVRQHLAKLVAAGLVEEAVEERHRPGRPRLLYTATGPAPAALDGRVTPAGEDGPYERLATVLVEAVRTGRPAREVGREVGGRLAGRAAGGGDPVAAVVAVMADEGFEPEVRQRGGTVDVVLRTCPYAAAARAGADVVCDLHRGLAEGVAAGAGGVEVVGLTVRDPDTAGCRLRLRPAPG